MTAPEEGTSQFLKNAQRIGIVTILTASIDIMVDGINSLILQKLDGQSLGEPLPQAAARKIAFLVKAYRRLPLLAPYKEDVANLIGRLRWLKDRRHDLVHGVLLNALGTDLVVQRFLHHEPEGARMRVETYSEIDVLVVIRMALDTFARAIVLLQRMAADLLDEVPESVRKFDVGDFLAVIERGEASGALRDEPLTS